MLKILLILGLSAATAYMAWYLSRVLLLTWLLLLTAAGADSPPYRLLSRVAPRTTREVSQDWQDVSPRTAALVKLSFRNSWPYGMLFALALVALPAFVILLLWALALRLF